MKLRALAKINLGLDVTGKREDGYHEVRMVMQTIQMYDQLEIKERKEPGIRLTTNLPFLPCNDGNLVYKAAKLLMDEFDIHQGVDMNLTKFIPVAAGMAGGSSDAAAALVGINRMFQLGLTKRQLMERGVQIGADVPYCVMRGTALAEGIGEKLTSLPGVPMCYVLIGKPGINVSTKFVYGNLHLDEVTEHPDIDGMVEAIRNHDLYEKRCGQCDDERQRPDRIRHFRRSGQGRICPRSVKNKRTVETDIPDYSIKTGRYKVWQKMS